MKKLYFGVGFSDKIQRDKENWQHILLQSSIVSSYYFNLGVFQKSSGAKRISIVNKALVLTQKISVTLFFLASSYFQLDLFKKASNETENCLIWLSAPEELTYTVLWLFFISLSGKGYRNRQEYSLLIAK